MFEKCWFKLKDLSNRSSPKTTPAICFIQFRTLWRIAGHLSLLRAWTMDWLIPCSLANLKLFLMAMLQKTLLLFRFSETCELCSSQQLLRIHFSLSSNIIKGDSQWTLKNRNEQNGSKSINHSSQTWPFDQVKANFCFLRGSLRLLTAAKAYFVVAVDLSRVRMFLKMAINWRLPTRLKCCLQG